jgi:N-acetylglucosamine kinase-like BadF-type ATPase
LGVDGGASGVRTLLVDACGTALGYGENPGSGNHQGPGVESVMRHIAAAVEQARTGADLPLSRVTAAHFALAGDDVEDDHIALSGALATAFPGLSFTLSNDVWAGLRAGSPTGAGVAVNCGSGCGVVGRNARGEHTMIPDNGYMFGDSGGGVQIGVDAVRAVIRAWDGRGEATMLTPLILELTGQPDVAALYVALYRGQLRTVVRRQVTRLVLEAAAVGDEVATGILRRVGAELGLAGAVMVRRLGMHDDVFPFVLTGGTFRTLRSPLAEAAIERMREEAPHSIATLPLLMPVAGAALLAADAVGSPAGEEHVARLQEQGYGWHAEEVYD